MRIIIWGFAVEVDGRRVNCTADSLRDQLAEYEHGERREFDADVRFPDSFTGDVMHVMVSIPYGETRTYSGVAAELDSHTVAAGQTCGRNPVPLVVPCHRVVDTGSLGGFSAADGVDPKRAFLDHEHGAIRTGLDRFS